jgi:hypothetical protein
MNPAHAHLLLNHVPVLGTLFGLLLLGVALLKKSQELQRVALGVFVISALIAIPAYLTGEPAEGVVEGFAGVSHTLIEQHEAAASVALWGIEALGLLSLIGLLAFQGPRKISTGFSGGVLIVSLIVAGLMTRTANLGGEIRHSEIRGGLFSSAPADQTGMESLEGGGDHDND